MYVLPESLREELKDPFGPVVSDALSGHLGDGPIATVGDIVTSESLDEGILPQLMVVDGHTKRTEDPGVPDFPDEVNEIPVENDAGEITDELWQAVATAYAGSSCTLIRIDGEEDLAALPAIVHAPKGANVVYGQPDDGAVIVTVDQTTRERALDILARMEVV
jgi:uncharacterized protein (UPF0218 family)